MRKPKSDKDFYIEVTYSPDELTQIVGWYVANHMPAIYANYNLEDEQNASMIEDNAVKTLMEEGSNMLMNEYLGNLILDFSINSDENYEDE